MSGGQLCGGAWASGLRYRGANRAFGAENWIIQSDINQSIFPTMSTGEEDGLKTQNGFIS